MKNILHCRFCGAKIYRWGNKALNIHANSKSEEDQPHTCDKVTDKELKEFREGHNVSVQSRRA